MDVKELESKTVTELKELAKKAGISGISAMKKADLVSALAQGAPAAEPAPEAKAKAAAKPGKPGAAGRPKDKGKPDILSLKVEKRGLQSRIAAAIAEKDFGKVKELRNRKKKLRRILNHTEVIKPAPKAKTPETKA